MNAIVNGAFLSLPLTAAVWLAMRLLPRHALSAPARYLIWWAVLIAVVLLPAGYLPRRISPTPAVHVPSLMVAPIASTPQAAPTISVPVAAVAPPTFRFPINVVTGPWTFWLLLAWGATALLMLARLIVSCVALSRRKAATSEITFEHSRGRALSRKARVMVSCQIPAPMAAGFRHPAILLPASLFDQLESEEIEQIVLHESAHLARRDDYALVIERAIEAVFALHPAVRFIARQIDLEREIACDDRVVRVTGEPKSYAACLTRVAEMASKTPFAAAAFSRDFSQLGRRVDVLLDKTRMTGVRLLKTRLTLVAAALIIFMWMLAKTPALLAFSSPLPKPLQQQPVAAPAAVPIFKPQPKLIAQAPAPRPIPPTAASQPDPVVAFPVDVRDRDGRFVPGLTRDDFRIFEDNVQQPVSRFAVDTTPLAVFIVAMNWRELKQETLDALSGIEKTPGATIDYIQLAQEPNGLVAGMWADRAEARLKQLPNTRKLVLMIVSDSFWSSANLEFLEFLTERASVGGIRIASSHEGDLYPNPESKLRALTDPTTYYVLGYTPQTAESDGTQRRVKVEVDRPGLLIWGAAGTQAPCAEPIRSLLSLPDTARCF